MIAKSSQGDSPKLSLRGARRAMWQSKQHGELDVSIFTKVNRIWQNQVG